MFHVATGHYQLELYGELPPERTSGRAKLVDEFDVSAPTTAKGGATRLCAVTVAKGTEWPPFLVVAQRFSPSSECFFPGIALVEETSRLFVGAGERVLCYDLETPVRIWEDTADTGFWSWCRHGDIIVMSAELELAAWDTHGRKLWTTFVEPPWEYAVQGDVVHLDVMGTKSTFSLRTGPDHPRDGYER